MTTEDPKAESGGLESVVQQHKVLRERLKVLRDYIAGPEPPEDDMHDWAATLAEKILELHDLVYRHFRDEETSGTLDDLVDRFPRASRAIRALAGEHQRILANLRAVLSAAMVYAENKGSPRKNIRQWVASVLDQLEIHESQETELIQRLQYEDIGNKD